MLGYLDAWKTFSLDGVAFAMCMNGKFMHHILPWLKSTKKVFDSGNRSAHFERVGPS